MRILVQTFGSAGDVLPFVRVGAGLAARGHEVRLFANEIFAPHVAAAGLTLVETGSAREFEEQIADPDLWHPRKGPQVVLGKLVGAEFGASIDQLEEHLDDDSVVLASSLGFAARTLRELRDFPLVMAHLAPSMFRSSVRMPRYAGMFASDRSPRWLKRLWWWVVDANLRRIVGRGLTAERARRGLPPVRAVFDGWIHSPDATLGLFPDWFGPPQSDWPSVTLTGFPLEDGARARPVEHELLTWMDADEPPLVFTPGSANVHARAFLATATDVCRALRRRGLLVTRERGNAPAELPDGVRQVDYAPFGAILPHAAALVSHGGIGTVAQGLAAGVPQLVVSLGFDQVDNGSRLVDLGVGRLVSAPRFTGAHAVATVERTLTLPDAPRLACARRLQEDDAVTRTCDAVESMRSVRPRPA